MSKRINKERKKGRKEERKKEKKKKRKKEKNKPRRAIRCVSQAEIVVFGGFSLMLTDGHTDGRTDGRTDPFIEMRGRI